MARTIDEIQAEIIQYMQSDTMLSVLDSGSVSALWRLLTRVVATAIAAFENLFDLHRTETNEEIEKKKPHSLRFYRQKALDFQEGRTLVEDDVYYDNSGVDVGVVEAEKIIKYAAATEEPNKLIVKVNKDSSGDPVPLDAAEYDAFEGYINEVKDAGVRIEVLSTNADSLKLEIDVYYDPQVLNSTGARIDGSDNTPVQDAIKLFVKDVPFDGTFVKAKLTDNLQAVQGVFVPQVRQALAARFTGTNFTGIDVTYHPYSGFLKFYDENTDLVLNFIQQSDV